MAGHRLTSFEERGGKVIARFADPSGQPVAEAEGDILLGADGIHSAVRRQFYPGEKAVFDGYLHYRGIVESEPYLTGASMAVVGHRHHRAILYPVAKRPSGKVMINWLAYTKIPPGSPPLEAWDTAADQQACVDQYKGWTYPWLDLHGLFAGTPPSAVLQLPNVDRDPIPRWSFSRVTLIGDAAHPMQPVGAQAGSQAIVDGRVLAASLMATRDPAEALTRYQDAAHRRDERHDPAQPQSRSRNHPADRRGAGAGRLQAHPRCADAGRTGNHRIQLQESGRLRRRNGQQPQLVCRNAGRVGGI